MRWSVGRRLAVGFALPLFVLVAVGFVSHRALQASVETAAWVDHTHQVLYDLAELRATVSSGDSIHRAFLITGEEPYVSAYEPLVSHADEVRGRLSSLVSDNPEQTRRLVSLWAAVQAKVARQRERNALRRTHSLAETLSVVSMAETRQNEDALRSLFDDMATQENVLLVQRSRESEASTARAKDMIVWGTLLGFLLVAAGAVVITRGITGPLREGIQAIASSAAEILAATTQQSSGAAEGASAIQQTSTTVHEMRQTAQLSSDKARAVVETVRRTTQSSDDGLRAVNQTIEGLRKAKTGMEGIARRVLALSEQGQRIGEINASVGDLAEQSNLLAVNAAIEAARAGESGRGFAVVAAEVKALSDQSKQATAQVRQILGEVQKATQSAVLATEEGMKSAETVEELAGRSGESIRLLSESLEESAQAGHQILATAQEQSAGVDQVAMAMDNIRQVSAASMAATRQLERAARDLYALAQRFSDLASGSRGRAAAERGVDAPALGAAAGDGPA